MVEISGVAVYVDSVNRISAAHEFNFFNLKAALVGVVNFKRLGSRTHSGKNGIENEGVCGEGQVGF